MRKNILLVVLILLLIGLGAFLFWDRQAEVKVEKPEDKIEESQKKSDSLAPKGEKLLEKLEADSNGDGEEEIHFLTEENGLFNIYITNWAGEILYSQKNNLVRPDYLKTDNYPGDSHPSLFVGFENQFKEGYLIRWDGLEYSISDEEKGF